MTNKKPGIVMRYSNPTQSSKEPYGTRWHIIKSCRPTKCLFQVSKDSAHPKWVRLGILLEGMLFDKSEDAEFMEECIQKYLLDHSDEE
jgi:hypothetical protein